MRITRFKGTKRREKKLILYINMHERKNYLHTQFIREEEVRKNGIEENFSMKWK